MTVMSPLDSAPLVLIRQTDRGFVLQSERNTMVSGFLKGKPVVFAQTLLTSLMGLCPVAHREAFETATLGRCASQASLRLAVEAMLESVRVFCVDWQRFVPEVTVREETLWELGQLRQRLFDVLSTRNEKATERLFVDAQRFVRDFQITYAELLDALLKAVKIFSSLKAIEPRALLTPSQYREKRNLERLLEALQLDDHFAVSPEMDGHRVLGSLARRIALWPQDEKSVISLVLARWQELTEWSRSDRLCLETFEPTVVSLDGGWQVAVVETVRGTLMHAVKVKAGVLEDFHFVAPTEWAFQSESVLIDKVNEFASHSRLQGQALAQAVALLVALFDACTDVQVISGEVHA